MMVSTTFPPAGGDVDIGWKLLTAAMVTFLSACIVIALRFLARILYARPGWDDYLMLFALVQALAATILDFVAVHHGLGRHAFYLTKDQRVKQAYYSLLAQVFCVNALTFAKISICLLYLRVLKGSFRRWLRVTCYLTMFLVFAVNTVVIISFFAQCNPPSKAWTPTEKGTCWKAPTEISLVLLQGSFSALTDFFLSLLPIFLLKDLQVNHIQKWILCGLMGLGVITGIFAIIRTVEAAAGLKGPPTDSSYSSILGLMWAGMERNIAMMVASVPTIRPLAGPFLRLTSKTFSSLRRGTGISAHRSYEMNSSGAFKNTGMESGGRNLSTGNASATTNAKSATSQEAILPIQAPDYV